MHPSKRKYLKNAASNLLSVGSSALMAVALPHYFSRDFSPTEFSLWVLVLQLGAYVNFLNFGVQTAVGRYVAHALSKDDRRQAEEIASAGFQILSLLGLLGVALLMVVGIMLPHIFHKIDPSMISTARFMLVWIGGALILNLPTTTFLGVFVGHQRNDIPAFLALITKGTLAIILVLVAGATHDLRLCAEAYFVVSGVGSVLQYITFKRFCVGWNLKLFAISPAARRELISYCASLSVWSFAMLLVNGLDTTIVGIFDFNKVAAYGISISIINFFLTTFASVTNPLLQVFAKIHARDRIDQLIHLFMLVSKFTTVLLIGIGCWIVLPVAPVFKLWVGQRLALQAAPVVVVLVLANVLRNSAITYSYFLLSSGMQRKVLLGPLAEGISNLVVSVIATSKFGAIGAAWGTVAGAIVGLSVNYFYNFQRTLPRDFSIWKYFIENLGIPALATAPAIAVIFLQRAMELSMLVAIPFLAVASIPAFFILFKTYQSISEGAVAEKRGTLHGDVARVL
ncbi:oligosaccharide flippase family protein [Occallatibacter riparius]|uniref:Oligosaccharide flippase family protein n=1 Tax=Occallatibacter riparius TaxID=1002689 RepID=A0A9J7BTB6_9BACT|nr:oligosaccharide flippase family protein [Occallatibacter riparius]UWZ86139.1 oligosaccharide flippase family protein [Occallatibacter riparius]